MTLLACLRVLPKQLRSPLSETANSRSSLAMTGHLQWTGLQVSYQLDRYADNVVDVDGLLSELFLCWFVLGRVELNRPEALPVDFLVEVAFELCVRASLDCPGV